MIKVYLADLIEKTDLEGPGNRIALWFSGCSIRCSGCCNPHLFNQTEDQQISIQDLLEKIDEILSRYSDIEGISVLGGEPLDQPEALSELFEFIKSRGLSNMLFSGYTLAQIKRSENSGILDLVDVLVDGPYVDSLREEKRRWVGSSNQKIYFLSERYNDSMPCFSKSNEIEFQWKNGQLSIYGFPTEIVSQLEKSDNDSASKILNAREVDHSS